MSAIDVNEIQTLHLYSVDSSEIQLLRTMVDDKPAIQTVQVHSERMNEVQKLGILITGINTNAEDEASLACYGVKEGERCVEIENALGGHFTIGFDFDECGGEGMNFCQAFVNVFAPDMG
jgi:hypothetical protein